MSNPASKRNKQQLHSPFPPWGIFSSLSHLPIYEAKQKTAENLLLYILRRKFALLCLKPIKVRRNQEAIQASELLLPLDIGFQEIGWKMTSRS